MFNSRHSLLVCSGLFALLIACTRDTDGPSPVKTPEEELASFQISSDLKIELVAAEPMIQDPVVITFDEDGRLWVVEMRGFMSDMDGTEEQEKIGRVSVLEDINGDGRMDVSTIYIDSLIMPRALAVVQGGALIAENGALWLTQDFDGDLHADSKILIDADYAGSTQPEHAGNGLWRGVDNWYYNVKSRLRYQFHEGKWTRDSTEFRGQWGISHDNEGRLFYNYNWSQLHADLVPPNQLSRNRNHTPTTGIDHGLTTDRRIYPIRSNPAVNRGYIPGILDEEGRLLEFTAACSPYFYRGTALPRQYDGNVFVCEPSGNLIKRNVVIENGFHLSAYDPTPGKEFLASTDERFRPVFLASGPDGALYVADMYKGLIQYGAYMTPYLREQTLSRKLDQPAHCGRIWRVVSKDEKKKANVSRLSKASLATLIENLSHPNGWTRDIAQRLLVEKDHAGSVTSLKETVLNEENAYGRFHALWTLQGLKANDANFLFRVLSDTSLIMRNSALYLLGPLAEEDEKIRQQVGKHLVESLAQATPKEILQIALTASALEQEPAQRIFMEIIERYDSSALIRDAILSSLYNRESSFLQEILQSSYGKVYTPDKEIFLEMLTVAMVNRQNPNELATLIHQLDKSESTFGWQEKSILTAMSIQALTSKAKPIELHAMPEIFKRTDLGIDSLQLSALASLFEWPGHKVAEKRISRSTLTDDELKQFAIGRQHYLTTCAGCHGSDGKGLSRFAPPLAGSEWVIGDEKRLALITLHGMEGPLNVRGKRYDQPEILPVMPAHTTLDDAIIASILTYIRNEWGNSSGAITRRTIGITRNRAQGVVQPWTTATLEEYLRNTQGQD